MSQQVFHLNSCSSTATNEEINLNQRNNEPFVLIFQNQKERIVDNQCNTIAQELLIKNTNVIDVKITNSYCIILDSLGKVYYLKNDNKIRAVDKFIEGDATNQPQLINFTINDPINKIFGKFGDFSIFLSKNGNIYVLGNETSDFLRVNQFLADGIKFKKEFIYNENVIEAACGESYFLLLTETGKVFGFGFKTCGQLGNVYNAFSHLVESKIDHIPSKIVKVYATFSTSFALTENEMECGGYCSVIVTKQNKIFVSGAFNFGTFGNYENYTEIDLKNYLGNNYLNNNSKLKVKAGIYYTVFFTTSESKTISEIFNFKNCWKIYDVTFIL
ncbi:hypothetical protein ABK040_006203 [Willaertia magna]